MSEPDISKFIVGNDSVRNIPEGHAFELPPWSPQEAEGMARDDGIELGNEHWEVIDFLRQYYLQEGRPKSGRVLVDALEQKFEARGGRRHLYTLFPDGPVTQGCRIAGLPKPPYTTDPSFGSRE